MGQANLEQARATVREIGQRAASDPGLLERVQADPEAVLREAGLSGAEIAALGAGEAEDEVSGYRWVHCDAAKYSLIGVDTKPWNPPY
jgi:hypothetical protein